MAEVQWIKLKVGMFDGNSFKKIKRAKIGGVSYRDKLTAVWFELLDLAGKSNANGYLIDNNEIPYRSFEDIAIMLDREEKEIELCMQYFINERMVEIIDDVYCLTNFVRFQNKEGLDKIREQTRKRVAKYREKKLLAQSNATCNVTEALRNATDIELEKEKELEKDLFTTTTTAEAPSLTEVYFYFKGLYDGDAVKEAEKFHAYNANKGWTCLPNWKATADLWIARIDEKG
jgi:predicted phage replisome organizer